MDAKILDQVTASTVGKTYFVHGRIISENASTTISNIPFTPLAVIYIQDVDNGAFGALVKPSSLRPPIKITEWGTNYLKVTNLTEFTGYNFIILG